MKDEGPKFSNQLKQILPWIISKIIPSGLVPRMVLFLIKSKASCFNYYVSETPSKDGVVTKHGNKDDSYTLKVMSTLCTNRNKNTMCQMLRKPHLKISRVS